MAKERFEEIAKNTKSTVCFVQYSGFGDSGGTFPGKHIVENVNRIITDVERKTRKKADSVMGDSYGGLVALELLRKYNYKYRKVRFILTSPLISFDRLDKDPTSPQSKEGFARYLKEHSLIRKVDKKQLSNLMEHREMPDPFRSDVDGKNVVIYHYDEDRSLQCKTSEDFCRLKKAKMIELKGNRHALLNFEKKALNGILAD